jgi:hypothetical protein
MKNIYVGSTEWIKFATAIYYTLVGIYLLYTVHYNEQIAGNSVT